MKLKKICAVSLTCLLLLSQAGCGSGGGSNSSAGGSSLSGSDSASGAGTSSTGTTGGATATGGAAATGGTAAVDGTSSSGTASTGGAAVTGNAKLTWDVAPSGAAGYKVYYGSSSQNYTSSIAVGLVPTFSVNLPPGTYYFAVTALDSSGNESGYSNEVSKTIS